MEGITEQQLQSCEDAKKNKSGLKIEKHLEMMNDQQTKIWQVISSL